jgi:TRAP-type C4-dicarboxylate transport system substrate-binding protein
MHFQDAAKYVTDTGQPAIFLVVEISSRWYDSLPKDLQQIVDKDGATETVAINPFAVEVVDKMHKGWVAGGGELINLPPDEQAGMLKILASVGDDVSKTKPALSAAYQVVKDAAQRTQTAAKQ